MPTAAGLPENVARLSSGQGACSKYTIMGAYPCYLSNWVSTGFDLTGPSLTLDTACSSSLYALQVACESMAAGSCDAALLIGVNALLSPHFFRTLAENGVLSFSGSSIPFDAAADGFVRGEGAVAMVLLPGPAAAAARLPRVPRSACRVYADVVATGANHDGWKSMQGAPSAKAQVSLIKNALARAGVDPAHVAMAEAHATGTVAGDPVEAKALSAAFGMAPGRGAPLPVTSAKATFGHLEVRGRERKGGGAGKKKARPRGGGGGGGGGTWCVGWSREVSRTACVPSE